VYQADNVRKGDCSWDDQLSAMTYNRFQYYSKLRTYALDDSALVSSVLLYIRDGGTDKHFTAQWSLYVPHSGHYIYHQVYHSEMLSSTHTVY